MTQEILKRIEEEAIQFEDKHPYDAIHSAYFMGAKSERNKVLDEAIEKVESLRYIVNDHNERNGGRITGYNEAIDILESLKL